MNSKAMSLADLRFLVVEDHEFQRLALTQLLINLGARTVHGAYDGASALQVIHDPDRPVDIVITDLSMPGMDGVEFIRHLSSGNAHLSLILSSALSGPLLASVANMTQAYGVNLLGTLQKPASAVKLVPLIELHRGRTSRPAARAPPQTEFTHDEIAQAWETQAFESFLAPRVDLRSRALRAAQASMFWRHASRGLLAADQFMPALRQQGLNDDLVWQMLRKASAQCAALRRRGFNIKVAVNLELDSLADPDLAARIQRTVEKEGVEARHMVLGVAESSIDTDMAKAMENLVRLRVAGFGLSIADFGSGRMSHDQLARIAFTELAIQESFVAHAVSDDSARAGVATGLQLAKELSLQTVAVGIAGPEEWDLLSEWGCDLGQGGFISGPLPLEAFLEWASARALEHPESVPQEEQ